MTDNFKEIGSLFGREGAGAGFVKQTDKESFTFPWRATTAHPAGTRSRRMRLQGMRPERMTRTSDRTRSDKK